jgi:radical SAM protein (TIGR04043 family)/putative N-acetyltransferase (TIGR04045 family)
LHIGRIIAEMQSLGVRLPGESPRRTGGAGPAEAGTLEISGYTVNAPTSSPFVARSPYSVRSNGMETVLRKGDKELLPVSMVDRPRFYENRTKDGIPCSHVALLHGKDCLATTVIQKCVHWQKIARCRFCGIQLSLENKQTLSVKTPEQLAQVAHMAKELDHVTHVVLTTGNAKPPGKEIQALADSCAAIKRATGLPVHAQFMPPPDLGAMQTLKEAGLDTVGIHIESFDNEILRRIAPVKAAMGLPQYEETWKRAVEVFGPNQVSSFIIAGLGESPGSIVAGCFFLADLGVYPFLVPLRPIPGSLMEDARPPEPETMHGLYEKAAEILASKGLSASRSAAGCVRCGACSALSAYEMEPRDLTSHWVRTSEEREAAFRIRHEVFVREQKLFQNSDQDENDDKSIHLIAKHRGRIVGTVRVFRSSNGNAEWVGGRLAVRRGHRALGIGELLVKEAVACVKRQGCTKFHARIQQENVAFFESLGWNRIGTPELYMGRTHQLMEADLNHSGAGIPLEETGC